MRGICTRMSVSVSVRADRNRSRVGKQSLRHWGGNPEYTMVVTYSVNWTFWADHVGHILASDINDAGEYKPNWLERPPGLLTAS